MKPLRCLELMSGRNALSGINAPSGVLLRHSVLLGNVNIFACSLNTVRAWSPCSLQSAEFWRFHECCLIRPNKMRNEPGSPCKENGEEQWPRGYSEASLARVGMPFWRLYDLLFCPCCRSGEAYGTAGHDGSEGSFQFIAIDAVQAGFSSEYTVTRFFKDAGPR